MVAPTTLTTSITAGVTTGLASNSVTVHQAVNELTALGLRVLVYASGAYPARPTGVPAGMCRYVGPSQPTTWLAGDEWVNNS